MKLRKLQRSIRAVQNEHRIERCTCAGELHEQSGSHIERMTVSFTDLLLPRIISTSWLSVSALLLTAGFGPAFVAASTDPESIKVLFVTLAGVTVSALLLVLAAAGDYVQRLDSAVYLRRQLKQRVLQTRQRGTSLAASQRGSSCASISASTSMPFASITSTAPNVEERRSRPAPEADP